MTHREEKSGPIIDAESLHILLRDVKKRLIEEKKLSDILTEKEVDRLLQDVEKEMLAKIDKEKPLR